MEPADYKKTVPPAIHCYLLCTVLRPSFRVISYTTLNDRVAPNEVASTRSELVLKGLPMFGPSVRGNNLHILLVVCIQGGAPFAKGLLWRCSIRRLRVFSMGVDGNSYPYT